MCPTPSRPSWRPAYNISEQTVQAALGEDSVPSWRPFTLRVTDKFITYGQIYRGAETEVLLGAIARLERSVTADRGQEAFGHLRGNLLDMADAISRTKGEIAALAATVNEMIETLATFADQVTNVAREVGDFVLRRADGLWAYQLAVVIDDAAQGVTDVVRGMDLLDNTARQILLQRALGLPTPRYLHVPLVLADNGEKLSKQNGAQALDLSDPARCLEEARRFLVASGFQAR